MTDAETYGQVGRASVAWPCMRLAARWRGEARVLTERNETADDDHTRGAAQMLRACADELTRTALGPADVNPAGITPQEWSLVLAHLEGDLPPKPTPEELAATHSVTQKVRDLLAGVDASGSGSSGATAGG